jgi:aspartyl-tRNA(Asn)/glutamyl-tRNA(Gln) amidotransferase subunit C
MAITEQDVRKIAKLARLKLTDDEVKLYQGQLLKILESMTELGALDTAKVPPTTSVLGLSNVTREDQPKPFGDSEALLSNAPEREGPYYKVRKVIE